VSTPIRCSWCTTDPAYIYYHDNEWGLPVHDDQQLFELLVLESFQAGLSWLTVLRKRAAFRLAFEQFHISTVATMSEAAIERLLRDEGIIRHRGKIIAAIHNAQIVQLVQQEYGSLDSYFWSWVGGSPIINQPHTTSDLPSTTAISDAMSKDMKRRGFKFLGSTTCYAYMQAVGMVDDHIASSWKRTGQYEPTYTETLEHYW